MIDWRALTWSDDAVGDAVACLAGAAGLTAEHAAAGEGALGRSPPARASIEEAAQTLGIEALPVTLTYGDLTARIAHLAPALMRIPLAASKPAASADDAPDASAVEFGYLLLVGSNRRRVTVVTPSLSQTRLQTRALGARMAETLRAQPAEVVETWLDQASIPSGRRVRARDGLLTLLLAEQPLADVWLLRRDPGAPLARLLRERGWFRDAWTFVAAAMAQIALSTCAWWLLGAEVLEARMARGWLEAWMLLIATLVPCQVLTVWLGGRLGLGLAASLKQRLLCGALRLPPDTIRTQGSGGLLAMVGESEAVERAGLDGTVAAGIAILQLIAAGLLLHAGAGGLWHVGLLVVFAASVLIVAVQTCGRLARWTDQRFALSKRFVENVQGHRTRAVQGAPHTLHAAEDALLERYAGASRALDRRSDYLALLPARGWQLLGLVGLVPALLERPSTAKLAVSVLGILQAQQAFQVLSQSLGALLTAAVAWRSVRPLFDAARESPRGGTLASRPVGPSAARAGAVAMELRRVSFRYGATRRFALRECSLTLRHGERWLVQGASGSGKSTLANLMTGVYRPSSGLLLMDGLDQATLGDMGWRHRIASAPQFHENHLLAASLSFNLLMGRAWPPSSEDLAEAQDVCRELGLGPLLARMPSGIHQMVGETGWQLSHGERSRVFLARALLQRASVVVLDESFGALDPNTVHACMQTVRSRAPTLMVIAHP